MCICLASGSSGVTSQTAKRILEALESMSSPLIVSIYGKQSILSVVIIFIKSMTIQT